MKPKSTPANHHLTPCGMLSLVLLALPVANAAVIQTDIATTGDTIPGGAFVSAGNLLATNLSSALALPTGTFNEVVLRRLYDGTLGPLGSAGSESTVMPNQETIQFNLNGAFNLTTIRTYASWDGGRDGQSYAVKYATAATPNTFNTLYTLSRFDPNINFASSSTLVTLTEDSTGVLAENVVSLQFVFNGYENGGTGFREFQVLGTPVSSVPEPGTFLPAALIVAGALLRRRRPRSQQSIGRVS